MGQMSSPITVNYRKPPSLDVAFIAYYVPCSHWNRPQGRTSSTANYYFVERINWQGLPGAGPVKSEQ